ncbi:DNA methylase, partial [Sulfolobus sp. F3]
MGRDTNGSQFMIDLERAKRNRIKLDDIVETLESLNVKLSQEDLNKLKDNLIDARFEIVGDKIVLKPYVCLADILKNFVVKYDKANKRFIIRPMDYFDILKKLKENG